MKTFTLFFIILMIIFLQACRRAPVATSLSSAGADSLVTLWNKAWNEKNGVAVMKLIAEDATLIINKKVISGHDSIQKRFVNENIAFGNDLQVKKITSKVEKHYTWYCGSFSHLVIKHDSMTNTEKGNIIFTWKPQPDNSWKLSLISIQ